MEATSIVTQPSNSPPANQLGSENISIDPALEIASIMVLCTIAMTIYTGIPNRKRRSSTVTPPQGMMCRRCEYFSDNHYVKCALHPTTVMTERAIDCQDCHLKQESEWVKKMKNILPSIDRFFTK